MKHRPDDERIFRPASLPSSDLGPLFGETPPSVPVDSSERGAELAAKSSRSQQDRILLALRAAGCIPGSGKFLSREAIAERCELSVNAACGRLGPSGPLLVVAGESGHFPVMRVEDACTSSSGLAVFGYQLTAYGVRLADALARRNVEAA